MITFLTVLELSEWVSKRVDLRASVCGSGWCEGEVCEAPSTALAQSKRSMNGRDFCTCWGEVASSRPA